MLCYESVVKNVIDVAVFFFYNTFIFFAVIGSSMKFYYFILAYKKLTPQQL